MIFPSLTMMYKITIIDERKHYAVATKTVGQYSTLATTVCLPLEMQLFTVDKLWNTPSCQAVEKW